MCHLLAVSCWEVLGVPAPEGSGEEHRGLLPPGRAQSRGCSPSTRSSHCSRSRVKPRRVPGLGLGVLL